MEKTTQILNISKEDKVAIAKNINKIIQNDLTNNINFFEAHGETLCNDHIAFSKFLQELLNYEPSLENMEKLATAFFGNDTAVADLIWQEIQEAIGAGHGYSSLIGPLYDLYYQDTMYTQE